MMAQQQSQNTFLHIDSLYCEEEHWEGVRGECFEVEEETYYNGNNNPDNVPLLDQDLLWEDQELSSLLSKEEQNNIDLDFNKSLAENRYEAVEWILRVVAHHSFSTLTAVLAVNYLDRFLFSLEFEREKPWMAQLAAVSCLSLAAKVEESQVPLLLDFQVEETKYVFEAKTIQRMEILVLSTLKWKMNPVTPLSFLDYITRRLGFKNHLCWEFLNRCECVLLSVIADGRFLSYLPSVIATATMLHVITSIEPCVAVEYHNQLLGILGIDKDKVEDSCKLIQELSFGGFARQYNKRKFGSLPGSPKGVIDLYFNSDCSNDSWVSSSPEHHSKKSKVVDHATADILSIPR